jgi:hypothetical protein
MSGGVGVAWWQLFHLHLPFVIEDGGDIQRTHVVVWVEAAGLGMSNVNAGMVHDEQEASRRYGAGQQVLGVPLGSPKQRGKLG